MCQKWLLTFVLAWVIVGNIGVQALETKPLPLKEKALNALQTKGEDVDILPENIMVNYAINSSSQLEVMDNVGEVNFGWSQVVYDAKTKNVSLSSDRTKNSDFYIPVGFEEPLDRAKSSGSSAYMMVFLNDTVIQKTKDGKKITVASYIFNSQEVQMQLITDIVNLCNKVSKDDISKSFDGVTIDFENFYDKGLQKGYSNFLKALNKELEKNGKTLNVAVPPNTYFKGYDYRAIGDIADQVILMAHDYAPKQLTIDEMKQGSTVTPITPIGSIYDSLAAITHPETGVQDKSKILLQVSFGSVQWQVKNNQVINRRPYTPSYDKINTRLQQEGTKMYYDTRYQNPYAIYYDGDIKNVIWYEDEKSIAAKIHLANMFGINKIAIWRLGTIPNYEDQQDQEVNLDILTQLLE